MTINSTTTYTDTEIIFKDDFLLAANKFSGLLSVPGKGKHKEDCLSARVQVHFPDALIVHRLDMATSGIMIMALTKDVQRLLSIQFQTRDVEKTYIAVVDGYVNDASGSIDLPLICDWPNRPKQKVDFDIGKPSITHYKLLDYNEMNETTRVELKPETGRTHQLRVHMQSIGHPILGDRLYATTTALEKADRLLLHASRLTFTHPVTGECMDFISEAPF